MWTVTEFAPWFMMMASLDGAEYPDVPQQLIATRPEKTPSVPGELRSCANVAEHLSPPVVAGAEILAVFEPTLVDVGPILQRFGPNRPILAKLGAS